MPLVVVRVGFRLAAGAGIACRCRFRRRRSGSRTWGCLSGLGLGANAQREHGSKHEDSFIHINFSFELTVQVFGSTPCTPIRRDRRLSSNLTHLNPRNGLKFQNSGNFFGEGTNHKL